MPEFEDPPLSPEHTATPGDGDQTDLEAPNDQVSGRAFGKRRVVRKRSRRRRITYWVCGVLTFAVLAYASFYGYIVYKIEHGTQRSSAISGLPHAYSGQGLDLLLMGLDTRLDENDHALPADVYNALHAGTAADGGNNSNVLIYIHIPNDGSKAVAISIPRDDWVDIANCKTDYALRQFVPSGCKGKIKSAYGWALNEALNQGKTWHQAKDVARREQVQTVEQFLGIRISSFVEVTMGAFYEIAKQVQPIPVCVKESTTDSFSGADFKAGRQALSAARAVAFVRQRRDLYNRYDFTDLDRSRRQQAFIVSLLTKLKSAGVLLNPVALNSIVDVASSNVVISNGLDPIRVARLASNLSGGNLHLYTLPIVKFGQEDNEDVNIVDVPQIRAIVQNLVNPPASTTKHPLPSGAGYTIDAVDASGLTNHPAARVLTSLTKYGYAAGTASKSLPAIKGSTIGFNPTDTGAASALAQRLGGKVTLVPNDNAKAGVLTLTLGTALAKATSAPGAATAVSATGGGANGPLTSQLTSMTGGAIPCVK